MVSTYANAFGASPASAMALRTLEDPYTEELATDRTVINMAVFMIAGRTLIPAFLIAMTKGDAVDDIKY